MSQPGSSEWLQEQLSTLLASPYIHFNQPKVPGLQLRMGPGPIDLFSTRFSNMFTKDATGVVGGKEVDRDGLKQSLLALQKQWNPETAKFVAMEPQSAEHQTVTRLSWTPKQSDTSMDVVASASVKEEGGAQRIDKLSLEGNAGLLETSSSSSE